MLPVGNLINQVFSGSLQWETYTQRFSSSIPVDRVAGANQTQIGYWSDSQLWQTVAWSRFAYERNPLVKGVLNILIDHIGKPTVTWIGRSKYSSRVTRLWERFQEANCLGSAGYLSSSELAQDREKEIRIRWLRDGEVFVRFFLQDRGYPIHLRFVEPEQVRTPPTPRGRKYSHTWGIVTERDDNERIVGYWTYYPQSGDWEYVPRRYMVYGRRNADRNVKRGLPEIANLEMDFAHLWSLLRSVSVTAKAQASIAWIERFPGSLTEQILSSSSAPKPAETRFGPFLPGQPNQSPSFYGIDPNARSLESGTILAVNSGKEYEAGPTSDPGKYLEACSSLLHLFSLQWCLPDWITKGPEAYASALVNGSPFARRIESLQEEYSAIYGQVAMTFLRLMIQSGRLPGDTLKHVRPNVKLPKVIVADEGKQVDLLEKELKAGLLSEIDYLQSRGRDPRKTLAQRRRWKRLLQEYGIEEAPEEKEEKESSESDDVHPPGKRVLEEEECEKEDYHVMDTQTGHCTTVQRCPGWKPHEGSRYQLSGDCGSGNQHEGERPDVHGKQPGEPDIDGWRRVRERVSGVWERQKEEAKAILAELESSPKMRAEEISRKSAALGAIGTRALIVSQMSRLLEIASNTSCGHREIAASTLSSVIDHIREVAGIRGERQASLADEVSRIIDHLDSKKSDGDLATFADRLIVRVTSEIGKSIKDPRNEAIEKSGLPPLLGLAVGNHSFVGGDKYLSNIIALSSMTNEEQQDDRAIRDSVMAPLLKKVLNRAPYQAAANGIDEETKDFLFHSMINVTERTYSTIVRHLSKLHNLESIGDSKAQAQFLMGMFRELVENTPNLYGENGSRSRKKSLIKEFEDRLGVSRGEISEQRINDCRRLILAISQRCLLSYGTADISRRTHEERWQQATNGSMPVAASMPVVDLSSAKVAKDGTVRVYPISLKVHLSDSSDSFERVYDHAANSMREIGYESWREGIRDELKSRIASASNGLDPRKGEDVERLAENMRGAVRELRSGLEGTFSHWRGEAGREVFHREMVAMSLESLINLMKERPEVAASLKDGSVDIQDFTVIRLRARSLERKIGSQGDSFLEQQFSREGNRVEEIARLWRDIDSPDNQKKKGKG